VSILRLAAAAARRASSFFSAVAASVEVLDEQVEQALAKVEDLDRPLDELDRPAIAKPSLTFHIEQEFRDQDPSKVAEIFRRDIAKAVKASKTQCGPVAVLEPPEGEELERAQNAAKRRAGGS